MWIASASEPVYASGRLRNACAEVLARGAFYGVHVLEHELVHELGWDDGAGGSELQDGGPVLHVTDGHNAFPYELQLAAVTDDVLRYGTAARMTAQAAFAGYLNDAA